MRKSKLRQQIDRYCQHNHRGSFKTRKHRHFVLHKMVRDLFYTQHVPAKWHAINREQIQCLVAHWHKEKRSPSTVMKYMAIIREFFHHIEHEIPGISNQELGLKSAKTQLKKIQFSLEALDKISNPIAKMLLELQIYFGLTFSESIRLVPDIHLQEKSIWATRDLATNSHDRMIPIITDKQWLIIEAFKKFCPITNLLTTYSYHGVRSIYRTEMATIGLSSSKSYRYIYAKNRYVELCESLPSYKARQTLMREMGIRSRRSIWAYLHE